MFVYVSLNDMLEVRNWKLDVASNLQLLTSNFHLPMRTETDIRTLKDLREYYRALSDAARLKILAQLARRDATVSELARGLHISQPLVSWHLHRLKIAGLIRMKRNGREVHCSLDRARLDAHARQFDSLIANQ